MSFTSNMKFAGMLGLGACVAICCERTQAGRYANFNQALIAAINEMPKGGGYSVRKDAFNALQNSVSLDGSGKLQLKCAGATPTFCTAATYLALLRAMQLYGIEPDVALSAKLAQVKQPDGVGIWGRWNSNGPAVARMLQQTAAGTSFINREKAGPGDFVKIFWNEHIGKKERGHLVVFIKWVTMPDGKQGMRFWSGNIPKGFGMKDVPLEQCKFMIFSRITKPQNLRRLGELGERDEWLASMLNREYSRAEVIKQLGIKQ